VTDESVITHHAKDRTNHQSCLKDRTNHQSCLKFRRNVKLPRQMANSAARLEIPVENCSFY